MACEAGQAEQAGHGRLMSDSLNRDLGILR